MEWGTPWCICPGLWHGTPYPLLGVASAFCHPFPEWALSNFHQHTNHIVSGVARFTQESVGILTLQLPLQPTDPAPRWAIAWCIPQKTLHLFYTTWRTCVDSSMQIPERRTMGVYNHLN